MSNLLEGFKLYLANGAQLSAAAKTNNKKNKPRDRYAIARNRSKFTNSDILGGSIAGGIIALIVIIILIILFYKFIYPKYFKY
jgi:hypothetical protein